MHKRTFNWNGKIEERKWGKGRKKIGELSRKTGDGRRENEVRSRKTEDGSQKSEDGSQKSEDGSQKSEDGSQKAEGNRRKAEGRRPKHIISGQLKLKQTAIKWNYDAEADVLYIYFESPVEAEGVDLGNGAIARINNKTNEIAGFTIINPVQKIEFKIWRWNLNWMRKKIILTLQNMVSILMMKKNIWTPLYCKGR